MWPLRQRQVRPTVLEASAGEPPVLTAFLELRSSVRGSGPQPHFQANFWPPPCAAPPTLTGIPVWWNCTSGWSHQRGEGSTSLD